MKEAKHLKKKKKKLYQKIWFKRNVQKRKIYRQKAGKQLPEAGVGMKMKYDGGQGTYWLIDMFQNWSMSSKILHQRLRKQQKPPKPDPDSLWLEPQGGRN